jgi:hypothetical protein
LPGLRDLYGSGKIEQTELERRLWIVLKRDERQF